MRLGFEDMRGFERHGFRFGGWVEGSQCWRGMWIVQKVICCISIAGIEK
jgi:hypothetical protein